MKSTIFAMCSRARVLNATRDNVIWIAWMFANRWTSAIFKGNLWLQHANNSKVYALAIIRWKGNHLARLPNFPYIFITQLTEDVHLMPLSKLFALNIAITLFKINICNKINLSLSQRKEFLWPAFSCETYFGSFSNFTRRNAQKKLIVCECWHIFMIKLFKYFPVEMMQTKRAKGFKTNTREYRWQIFVQII